MMPTFLNSNILYNYNTLSKPGSWHFVPTVFHALGFPNDLFNISYRRSHIYVFLYKGVKYHVT